MEELIKVFPSLQKMLDYYFYFLMDCKRNIQKSAVIKLVEADCLFFYGHLDWSYYTASYAIELLLKVRVCKELRKP